MVVYKDYFYESEEDLDIYDDIGSEIDFDNEYEDAFLEGYYDAINEMRMNPLPIIGGGDFKGDIKAGYGFGDEPYRIDAVKDYLMQGNTIKGGIIGGTYGITKGGIGYRKNKVFPGYDYNVDDSIYRNIFLRLKPADRKKIMNAYYKKNGIPKL